MMRKVTKAWLAVLAIGVVIPMAVYAQNAFRTPANPTGVPDAPGAVAMCTNGATPPLYVPCSASNPLPVNASVSASISGFRPASYATPIAVTTGGVTGTLPSGSQVVATNVGANPAYCALGNAATTSDQYIAANGGWFGFAISGDTQITCITSSSTTTVNLAGGSGLPTGASGSGSGGSGGSVTQGTTPWVDSITTWGGGTLGAMANYGTSPGAVLVPGINAFVTNPVAASQSGAWTVNPTTAANWGLGATGAAVPANAHYLGINTGGNLVGLTTGQATVANSLPVTLPSNPDTRTSSGNITIQDTGSSSTTGQNNATIVTGAPTTNSFQSFAINGSSSARTQISGTWTGTLTFEGSVDGGTTWGTVISRVLGSVYTQGSVTGNGDFYSDVSGLTNFRVRATAAMTGAAVVQLTFSAAGGPVQVLNPVRIVDNGSGATVTIKGASTAPVATDTSLVTALNPNAPLPSGQNSLGNVGALTKTVCVTPTVTNGTYAGNVVIGGLLTFANLFTSTGHGTIQTVALNFNTVQTVGFKLYPFRGSPTNASTWTDHSAAAISGATDIFLTDQPIQLGNPDSGLGTMTNYGAIGLGQAYNPGGTSGYFILVPTATTASLGGTANVVQACVTVLQDS